MTDLSQGTPDRTADRRRIRMQTILEGPVGPTLAALAAPNILAMTVQTAQSIAEAYFASQLGVVTLAGLALVFPLVMLTQMLSAGAIGGAISASVARALGAADPARAATLAVAAWIIAISAAALMAILIMLFGRTIFGWMGGQEGSVDIALRYALVFFPGCITVWMCHASLSIIRGTGDMRMPAVVLLGVSSAAILLAGGLSLGWALFPKMGVAGLPTALITAHGAGALVAVIHIARGRTGLRFGGAWQRLDIGMFADIMRVGWLAALNTGLTILTIVVMVGLVGQFGEDALAGYGLGARVEFLMIPIIFGIGAAMTAMVGANIGAGQTERALRIAWTGSLAAAAIVGSIGIVLAVAPDLWLGLFLDETNSGALAAGRSYFRLVAPFYAFFGLGLALYFAAQGAGQMRWPVIGSLCRVGIAVGGAVLLTRITDLGIEGVFAAIGVAMLVYGLVIAAALNLFGWSTLRN